MLRRIAIGCLALTLAATAAPARADLTLYVQDTAIQSGGYSYLNIYLAGGSTDLFDTEQVTLSIAPIGPAAGAVTFAPNGAAPNPANTAAGEQPYNYLLPPGSTAPGYIFPNDSLDSTLNVNGGLQPSGYSASYFTINDSSFSGSEYAPMSAGPPTTSAPGTLLASLLIHAVSTNVGDQYAVSLVSNGSGGIGDTVFTNSGAAVAYAPALGTSPSFTGTITVSPAAVPEPSSLVLIATALATLAGSRGIRRRATS